MKKIISLLLLMMFLGNNLSFAQLLNPTTSPKTCATNYECDAGYKCDMSAASTTYLTCIPSNSGTCSNDSDCSAGYVCDKNSPSGTYLTCIKSSTETTNTGAGATSTSVMGIDCDQTKLVNGQCKLNIYDTLGIRKSVRDEGDPTSVGLFVQDIVLSATFFIGTLVTVALIVSGIMFIFAASSGKDPANAKKGIIGSLVGLLIVVSSYVIIRLVQYIAKGF